MIRKSFLVAALLLPALAQAQQPQFGMGAQLGYVANDGPTGSDFDGSFHLEAFGQLVFNPNVAVEAGWGHSTTTEDSAEDNTGKYTIEMSSNDLFAGVRLDLNPWGVFNLYGRGGLLYYYTTIDFAESFYGIKPAGKLEEIEEGIGYYLEGGGAFQVAPNMKLHVGLTYRNRQEYFEDSSRPFDMEELGLQAGLTVTLP